MYILHQNKYKMNITSIKKQERIAIDMDGVLVNTPLRAVEWYKRDFGIELDLAAIHGQRLYDIVDPAHRDTVKMYPHQLGYFADLPPMEDGIETVRALSERYEIFITTAAMQFQHSLNDKYNWLSEHLSFTNWQQWVFCGAKSVIRADYMIDDHIFNLDVFEGKGFLFTQHHNRHIKGYHRVDNWQQIAEALL